MKPKKTLKMNFEGKNKISNAWGISKEVEYALKKLIEIHDKIEDKIEDVSETCRNVSKAG